MALSRRPSVVAVAPLCHSGDTAGKVPHRLVDPGSLLALARDREPTGASPRDQRRPGLRASVPTRLPLCSRRDWWIRRGLQKWRRAGLLLPLPGSLGSSPVLAEEDTHSRTLFCQVTVPGSSAS